MALRSLNASIPERGKGMHRSSRFPPFVGANDENVDLQWSPNLPPPASCKPLPLSVCSEAPSTGKPSSSPPCGEGPTLCSPPSPARSEVSVPLCCNALPPAGYCEGPAPQPSFSPVCREVPCCGEASAPLPSSSESLRSPSCSKASASLSPSAEPPRSTARSEASAPLPSAAEPAAEVEYILSEHLPTLVDVDDIVSNLLRRLDSKNWLNVCEALNSMRQLSIYHKSSLLQLLDKAVPLLVKATKNPRSALCKTAIMASADLFRAFPEEIVELLEQLLLQLLLKASQDKKFVCDEAERSLEVMTRCLPPMLLLLQLQPYVMHRNPRVRAKATSCVHRSVTKLGPEGIRYFGFQPLLEIAATQLSDQLPEARESARKLVAEVYTAFPGPATSASEDIKPHQQDWHLFCNAHLSSHFSQAILRLTSDS